jgi:hypothetical protein
MISFLICSSINTGQPTCISFTFKICALSIVFSASSGALCCVKVVCHWLYCKSVDLVFPRLLHCFQSLLKVFWSLLKTSVLDVISSRSQPFSFGISSCHANFLTASIFPVSHQNFLSYFATMPIFSTTPEFSVILCYRAQFFHCGEIFRRTLLPRPVFPLRGTFSCISLPLRVSPLRKKILPHLTVAP